ncbi:MAG: septum formation initiator family protein [Candidatus Omnitrophica bacterium]|nr:septum formation initiator family protein [Candidatus Omnitrophota bacterium]
MRKIRNNWFLLVSILFIFLISIRLKIFYSAYSNFKFYQNEINRLKEENRILAEKIKKIKNDPYYIEKILREEYGMVKDGEFIIKIGE